MMKYFFFLMALGCSLLIRGQNTAAHVTDLAEGEKRLYILFNQIVQNKDNEQRKEYNDSVRIIFSQLLKDDNSFGYSFEQLRNVGKIWSLDNKLKIYNWNFPLEDGTHLYYCFLQYKGEKGFHVTELSNHSDREFDREGMALNAEDWYGALYYEIIVTQLGQKTYYTLLGLDFHDRFSSRKIIEILSFNEEGIPVFGAPLFYTKEGIRHRVIFEFSSRVSMLLKFDEQTGMIIHNHLAPIEPLFTGQYQYYGPDSSVDGFVFTNNRWHFVEDLDIRNSNRKGSRR